jgi:hypothetical protein
MHVAGIDAHAPYIVVAIVNNDGTMPTRSGSRKAIAPNLSANLPAADPSQKATHQVYRRPTST